MRVISGKWRGKKLLSFKGEDIRPTTDRIKETIFNMITTKKFGSRILNNAIILDCFAGTSALSIESLSRGSRFAYIWDNSLQSINLIKENLQNIDENLYKLTKMNAYTPMETHESAHIIFIDPPYAQINQMPNLLTSLENANWINSKTLLIIESSTLNPPELSANYNILETKIMGKTTVTFIRKKE